MEKDLRDFNDTVPHATDFSDSSEGYYSMLDSGGATHRPRKRAGGIAGVLLTIGLGVLALLGMAHWLRH